MYAILSEFNANAKKSAMTDRGILLKSILCTVSLITSLLFTVEPARAQYDGFGIGVILGEPVGVSGKVWTSEDNAFDGAVAWSFVGTGALYLHSDYLWHQFNLIQVEKGTMPIYYGGGARLVIGDDTKFGIRGVAGLAYLFDTAPVEIFLELGPIFDFIPATGFSMTGGVGVRYYISD